jgi:rubredoxin
MALVMALEQARSKSKYIGESEGKKGESHQVPFFGARNIPDLPLASLNQHSKGYYNTTHFHTSDQFQVVISGEGMLGRHEVHPFSVHFTKAYTPYGPLKSETKGLTFFVMRTHPETGACRLPECMDQLKAATDRRPWQVTATADFPDASKIKGDAALKPLSGVSDEDGLAAYTLTVKPNAITQAPDATIGDGQYLVVVKGSFIHDDREHKAPALVFVWPRDGRYELCAGPQGCEAVVVNFPRVLTRPAPAKQASAAPGAKKYQCTLCSFSYDEAQGLPQEGIAPGTRWTDLPHDWTCPDCAAGKIDFEEA